MKCTLPIDINNCQFCNRQDMICENKEDCSFQEKNRETKNNNDKPYVREERWFEHLYHKHSKPIKE